MEDIFEKSAAVSSIKAKFDNEGDFDFMKPEELENVIKKLVEVDHDYIASLGDDAYDEEFIYDRLLAAANETLPSYKTYLMRLVDDYMDFMEQYLVDEGLIEWD